MVFHRLEIRTKVTNVAEINTKSIEESVKTPMLSTEGQSSLGTFLVSSQD